MRRWSPARIAVTILVTIAVSVPAGWLLWLEAQAAGLRFERPAALLLLVAAPFALFTGLFLEWRRTPRIRFSRGMDLTVLPAGALARLWALPHVVRSLALALVAVALARPQTVSGKEEAELEGIDIVLVLDLSNSMRATDLQPNRLVAAKAVIDDFILRRQTDRIGAVVFGREAFTLCPLTLDYSALRGMFASLQLGVLDGRGTAIGNGIGTAINRLRRSNAKSKVVILLTDGDNNSGNMSPEQAAEFAKTLRIKVYSVLMGMPPENAPAPRTDIFGRPVPGDERYPVRPELLREVSRKTGGQFYQVGDTRGLQMSFHAILNQLDRSKIADAGVLYGEVFGPFVIGALALLLLEILMRLTIWRKFP
ncbi:MAG: VWA domain-containing protein [Deltaproteobacteria bacterium]|nr:VWA domain-containing protein [Deltaproteobacteria bacterium]